VAHSLRLCKALHVLNQDRLLPAEPGVRQIARRLYECTKSLPIVSPHSHCDPGVLADDSTLGDPAFELVTRDHYILRLLFSHGIPLDSLGVRVLDGSSAEADGKRVWQQLGDHYHLFRGTPTKLWLDHTLAEVLDIEVPLRSDTAGEIYDEARHRLAQDAYRARSLYERFGIEFLATTEGALDRLEAHGRLRRSGWDGCVVPTFRPDDVLDPSNPAFRSNVSALAEMTGEDTSTWAGYLDALRIRRKRFIEAGATASDHGHPSPATADLPLAEKEQLFARVTKGDKEPGDDELFRAQMLVEMAEMSLDDGLVMQLHVGAWRDHNSVLSAHYGRDVGADIPKAVDYVANLKPLLDRFGNESSLRIVVYTLDEATLSRELAPMAGHYPALKLGPPWWFYDSPEGIRRFYRRVVETAGFANTVGFNDDARSLLTIPARHDVARRLNAGYLAGLVAEHQFDESDALEIAEDLAYRLACDTFRVPR
jgi:glucuronate isomerase